MSSVFQDEDHDLVLHGRSVVVMWRNGRYERAEFSQRWLFTSISLLLWLGIYGEAVLSFVYLGGWRIMAALRRP